MAVVRFQSPMYDMAVVRFQSPMNDMSMCDVVMVGATYRGLGKVKHGTTTIPPPMCSVLAAPCCTTRHFAEALRGLHPPSLYRATRHRTALMTSPVVRGRAERYDTDDVTCLTWTRGAVRH
ncbi:hypothetical protein Vretimale_6194 [Volvox reticuliferus]|uniref:Uncharacterized protein n=1 Tax=Volvox reticuliferus TaxID=1737510 RepID=A0A8J4LLY9_9CHLO|nr:hypothetical protein Vretimale_6194 [Volvox reticuliferus]